MIWRSSGPQHLLYEHPSTVVASLSSCQQECCGQTTERRCDESLEEEAGAETVEVRMDLDMCCCVIHMALVAILHVTVAPIPTAHSRPAGISSLS